MQHSLLTQLSVDLTPLTGGLFFRAFINGQTMDKPLSLYDAYREYLTRMLEQSNDLVVVDVFTVPQDVDVTSPTVQEWAHFE